MNELNLFNPKQEITMSSKEIAQLTGKSHNHVLRDCDELNRNYLVMNVNPILGSHENVSMPNGGKRKDRVYLLTKIQCLDLLTGYNTELRIKVNRRWAELEAKEQTKLPQTFSEALQLAADQAKQLELQAPKVQFAESVLESKTSISIRNMAKMIGFGQNKFFEQLRNDKILIAIGNSRNTPYQRFIDAGYFELTERTWPNGEGITFVTRVTPKGQQYLTSKYAK